MATADPHTSIDAGASAGESGAESVETARVRLVGVRTHRGPSGRLRVDVELLSPDGRRVIASHEDLGGPATDVRIGAEAAVAAIHASMPDGARFEIAGAKTVRAFDQTVALVLVGIHGRTGPARLLGAACNEEDVARAAVLAVLNATNRVSGVTPPRPSSAATDGDAR